LQLDLTRDNTCLLPWPFAFERKPTRFRFDSFVLKDFFECHVKLAHVILPETILVPANDIEEEVLGGVDWELFDDVPFGIEGFGDRVGDNSTVSGSDDKIL
jgi:hypothetical protein